ncbi:YkgJ family cysteine cluster protein [Thermoproteota archaeon]
MTNCRNCGNCCNHVAIEIDEPTTKAEYQEILWFLLHKGVKVFVDYDDEWFVEFPALCEWRKNDKCVNHGQRPSICKDYSSKDCVNTGDDKVEKLTFDTHDDFMKFLEKKGVDYRFKWQKS